MMRTNTVPIAAETSEPAFVWEMKLPDEAATAALGRLIAEELRPGDCLALSGGLGAGKTTLARAIIRNLAGDPGLDVPSPTFTLMQGYDSPAGPLVHADLYRIGGPDELHEIGWDEWLGRSVLLVEWPERAGSALPPSRLQVELGVNPAEPEARRATLIGYRRLRRAARPDRGPCACSSTRSAGPGRRACPSRATPPPAPTSAW